MSRIFSLFIVLILTISFLGIFSESNNATDNDYEKNDTSSRGGPTYVSGVISVNTTWTVANSPYIAKSNLLVDNQTTLTIKPGVVVKFDQGYYLMVKGTLSAVGNENNYIVFTSNQGSWEYIKFEDESNDLNSSIEYCEIKYADRGIYCYYSSPRISNNIISNNRDGINCWYSNIHRINNNTIEMNERGIVMAKSSPIIFNNSINRNKQGISCHEKSSPTIIYNNISRNDRGIVFEFGGSAKIYNNTINKNKKGIHIFGQPELYPKISNNNILDNFEYNIQNEYNKNDVNATNNYWGTIEILQIDNRIYDFYDDFQWGKVIYKPFLQDPSTDAPKFEKNKPPIAEAGSDQSIIINKTLIFDGSKSYDPDNDVLTYKWDFGDGTSTDWQDNCNASYIYNKTGIYTVTIMVSDGLLTDNDTCKVNVSGEGEVPQPTFYIIINSPANGQVVNGTIQIIGTAFSEAGEVTSVQVKIDNNSYELATPGERVKKVYNPETGLYEDVIIPDWSIWSYSWNTTEFNNGLHMITVQAIDQVNNIAKEEINVTVNNTQNIPVNMIFEITHPNEGGVLNGTVEISGKFWSSSKSIPSIKLKIGDGSWFIPDVFQWYDWWLFNYLWDTTKYNDGIYEIAVKGKIDSEELVDSVLVVVNNGGNKSSFGVKITNPQNAEILNGTYTVIGYTWNYDYDILGIEIRVDNHPWQEVTELDQKHISNNDDPESDPETSFKLNWIDWSHELDSRPYKEGIHEITVKVYDSKATKFSFVNVIFINEEYSPDDIDPDQTEEVLGIKITHPYNGEIVIGSVEIQGLAWSRFENITSVEIQIDELGYIPAQAAEEDWTVWGYIWDTTIHKNGIHKISVRINVVIGEKTLSDTTTVLVIINNAVEGPGQPPRADIEVIIWTPKENETVSGVIEVFGFGWASNNGTIQEIQIKIDDGLWLQANPIHSDWWTWNYSLNTSEYENGKHKLTARLNTGKVLINSSINFNINNTGKSVITDDPVTPDNGEEDEDIDDESNGKTESDKDYLKSTFLYAIIIALIIIIIITLFYSIIYQNLRKKKEKGDRDLKDTDSRIEAAGTGIPVEHPITPERQKDQEDFIRNLKDEALVPEKPSDFDLSNDGMLETFKRRYEAGEISRETYDSILETLDVQNDKLEIEWRL
ncbi:MAG: right-handed parallel beta-helix repeat-containing protein [Thermoplasmata archaeon]|nr:MAG: right-handed parallel beta-helix repeat-containing protein [Thermoplasmata archaeon]